MKPSFHAMSLNGPFDDPCIYVRILREGRSFLFDLGFTTALSPKDILKIAMIFVSHTHVDHFIGFDNILRVSLKKEDTLKLYGPKGFIDCVEGKLRGYTWNLIGDYPLVIEVAEVGDGCIERALFRADNYFKRQEMGTEHFERVIMRDASCFVSAEILDHGVPCLAFSLEEDYHINIDKARLNDMDLPVGPWLGEFKTAIRENQKEKTFTINGRTFSFRDLDCIATKERGQKVSYVVDAIGSDANIGKIINFVQGADVLYIETYFLDRDKMRARDRYHLTAREAGMIARKAGVGRMEAVHFSPRYIDNPDELLREAREEFQGEK
jgi:ribonuclease Z